MYRPMWAGLRRYEFVPDEDNAYLVDFAKCAHSATSFRVSLSKPPPVCTAGSWFQIQMCQKGSGCLSSPSDTLLFNNATQVLGR